MLLKIKFTFIFVCFLFIILSLILCNFFRFKVDGKLVNTGNDITYFFSNDNPYDADITGGPLSYAYTVTDIKFHFGKGRNNQSEHSVNGTSFPAEVSWWHRRYLNI